MWFLRKKMHQNHTHLLIRIMNKLDCIAKQKRRRHTLDTNRTRNHTNNYSIEQIDTNNSISGHDTTNVYNDGDIRSRLTNLELSLSTYDSSSLLSRVRVMSADVKQLCHSCNILNGVSSTQFASLDIVSEENLMKLLSQQNDAVRKLDEALRKDMHNISIMLSS